MEGFKGRKFLSASRKRSPATLPEYLFGQNPKKKNVLSIFRKNQSRANPKSKEHFSLGLPSGARQWRGFRSLRIFDKIGSSEVVKTLQFCRKRYRRPKSVGRAKRVPLISPHFSKRIRSPAFGGTNCFFAKKEVRNPMQFFLIICFAIQKEFLV